jgi:hypothetical protein
LSLHPVYRRRQNGGFVAPKPSIADDKNGPSRPDLPCGQFLSQPSIADKIPSITDDKPSIADDKPSIADKVWSKYLVFIGEFRL